MTSKTAAGATIEPNVHVEKQSAGERETQRAATEKLIQEQMTDTTSAAYLKARKAEIDAQYKAAREAEKAARAALKGEKAARTRNGAPTHATKALTVRVQKLIKAGKTRDEAFTVVFAQMRSAIVALLDTSTASEK